MKNVMAFFGLIFFTLIIGICVLFLGYLYNQIDLISLPEITFPSQQQGTPGPDSIKIQASGPMKVDKINLIPSSATPETTLTPIPTMTVVPTVLPTMIATLQPPIYQAQVIVRLKDYAAVLQQWLALNDKLAADKTLIDNPDWRSQTQSLLGSISQAGQALGGVGPAPNEYRDIDALLKMVAGETQAMVASYSQGIDTQNWQSLEAAGENFSRIKTYLNAAAEKMMSAGWQVQ